MPQWESFATANVALLHQESGRSVGMQLRRIVTHLITAIDQRMEPLGLTDAQWRPLVHLLRHSPTTASALAQCCAIDTGGLTRLVDRLQAKGLCQRERSDTDRRVVHIRLTPAGEQVAARLPAILATVQQELLHGLSAGEEAQLRQLLDRLEANAAASTTGNKR